MLIIRIGIRFLLKNDEVRKMFMKRQHISTTVNPLILTVYAPSNTRHHPFRNRDLTNFNYVFLDVSGKGNKFAEQEPNKL